MRQSTAKRYSVKHFTEWLQTISPTAAFAKTADGCILSAYANDCCRCKQRHQTFESSNPRYAARIMNTRKVCYRLGARQANLYFKFASGLRPRYRAQKVQTMFNVGSKPVKKLEDLGKGLLPAATHGILPL